jgi:hypothetical protein
MAQEESWEMVSCRSDKKKKQKRGAEKVGVMVKPAIATRSSKRICRDGIPMLQKAKTRMAKKNDTSGNNPFTVLQAATNCKLARIANNCGAVLGDNVEQIDSMIDILKAKEQAEAVLAENRCKVILERERKECLGDVSPIGLANFQCCVQDSNEDDDSSGAVLVSELPTPW